MTLPARLARRPAAALALALAALPALPPDGAQASKIKPVELTCPIGGARFKQMSVFSGSATGRRLDTRPFGRIVTPFPLPVCKSNGFVMYQERFTGGELAKLTPIVKSTAYQALRRTHRSYYLAAYLRERMGAPDIDLAALYLKASWQAEGRWAPQGGDDEAPAPDRALVEQYRQLALAKLDAFLSQAGSRSSESWQAAVLAAELERLLGRFSQVETRLAKLLSDADSAGAGQRSAMAQIRAFARAGNASPQVLGPADPG